ncbi:MAG: transposase [Bacillaceae bacterium]|nr:transposase [Bacillaceae bacterium]
MVKERNNHDHWFKELLSTFFEEFILAFFPDVYEHLDFQHITFLNQEVFTDIIEGSKGIVNLLVETKLKGEDAIIIVHIENQSSYEKNFHQRMFFYFSRLYEKYKRPIVPIAIFSYDKNKPEHNSLIMSFPFKNVLSFQYLTLQLKQKNWRDYINQPNPAALALLGKMGYEPQEKVKIKFEFLRMLIQLELDPGRQKLVHGIFEKYHKLSKQEELQLKKVLTQIPNDEVKHIMELMTSWEKKGFDKGIAQGIKKGIEQGIEQGIGQGVERVATQMILKGFPSHDISDLTGLSLVEIEKLKKQLDSDVNS